MTRADDDIWDPATGVGMTATFGAVARAVGTNKGLINDPFAEHLVRAAGVDYFTRVIEDQRYADDGGGSSVTTGLIDVLAVHARFVDEYLAEAGRAGIRQVVILGSGMDTRPYRLWWPPGTTVYEIDQPEVMDFKTKVLRGPGAELTANRRAIGINLRQDWPDGLRRVGFDAALPTVWVAEGLLVGYLSPDAQNRLLQRLTAVSATGSRFAADHMPTWSPSQLAQGRAFRYLAPTGVGRRSGRADLHGRIPLCPPLSGSLWLGNGRAENRGFIRRDWNGQPVARRPRGRGDHPAECHRHTVRGARLSAAGMHPPARRWTVR